MVLKNLAVKAKMPTGRVIAKVVLRFLRTITLDAISRDPLLLELQVVRHGS